MKKALFIKLFCLFSLILNIFMVVSLIQSHLKSEEYTAEEKLDLDMNFNDSDVEWYYNKLEENQLFYGTWEVIDLVSPDYALPSSYSGFDAEGNFRGPDYDRLINQDISFGADYVEFNDVKYLYAYKPRTYTYSLPVPNNQVGYYDTIHLGLDGNCYSEICFFLPDHVFVNGVDAKNKNILEFSDFNLLIIKNKNTMYISNGVLMFLLERKA